MAVRATPNRPESRRAALARPPRNVIINVNSLAIYGENHRFVIIYDNEMRQSAVVEQGQLTQALLDPALVGWSWYPLICLLELPLLAESAVESH